MLDLALRHGHHIKQAVVDAGDCGGDQAIRPSPDVIQTLTETSGTPEEQGQRKLALLFPPEWLARNFTYIRSVFEPPREPLDPANIELQEAAIDAWPGISDQLEQITPPVMIVRGMADILTPPENAQILAARIPG